MNIFITGNDAGAGEAVLNAGNGIIRESKGEEVLL
jgi:hypothetical protein